MDRHDHSQSQNGQTDRKEEAGLRTYKRKEGGPRYFVLP